MDILQLIFTNCGWCPTCVFFIDGANVFEPAGFKIYMGQQAEIYAKVEELIQRGKLEEALKLSKTLNGLAYKFEVGYQQTKIYFLQEKFDLAVKTAYNVYSMIESDDKDGTKYLDLIRLHDPAAKDADKQFLKILGEIKKIVDKVSFTISKKDYAYGLLNIAIASYYYVLDEKTEDLFLRCLNEYYEEYEGKAKGELLFYFTVLCLETGCKDYLKYVNELEMMASSTNFPEIKQRYRFIKGVSLYSAPRIQDLAKAQHILRELAYAQDTLFEIRPFALYYYSETLIKELFFSLDEVIIKQVEEVVEEINALAEQRQSRVLPIRSNIIMAKLHFLRGKSEKSKQCFNRIHKILHDNELRRYKTLLDDAENQLVMLSEQWKQLNSTTHALVDTLKVDLLKSYFSSKEER